MSQAVQREELFEMGAVLLVNAGFVALATVFFWLLGRAPVGGSLAKGYAVLWSLLVASILVLYLLERLFGLSLETRYVYVNLAVCVVLVAGWSAFAALTVGRAAVGASLFTAGSLYAVGFVSCYVAYAAASSFYQGSLYKVVSLPLALVGFVVFALWPALGQAIFGWFFALFGWAG